MALTDQFLQKLLIRSGIRKEAAAELVERTAGGGADSRIRAEYRTNHAMLDVHDVMPWTYNPAIQPEETLYYPLDLTDPQYPTVVEDGIYAVSVLVRSDGWDGHDAELNGVQLSIALGMDDFGFGWYAANTTTLGPLLDVGVIRRGAAFASSTLWLPAGAVVDVYTHHTDVGEPLPFTMFANVQKL